MTPAALDVYAAVRRAFLTAPAARIRTEQRAGSITVHVTERHGLDEVHLSAVLVIHAPSATQARNFAEHVRRRRDRELGGTGVRPIPRRNP